jgi:sugar/nucleoside kinase (ribokinase family)
MSVTLDALVMGEALWDLEAPRGRTFASAPSLRLTPGGAAINVALALSRLGFRAGLAAILGADALGDALLARVSARGVSTALVQRTSDRTGLVLVERAGGPAARVVSYRPASEAAPSLPEGAGARLLVLTGLLPSEAQAASFGAAALSARRQGAHVVVDLNARPRPWRGRPLTSPPAWLDQVTVIKASEEDLAALGLRESTLRAALDPSAVLVVTAGARAARASGPFGAVTRAPIPREGSALGAGDAFTAGLCDALLRGGDGAAALDRAFWERALRRGHGLARRRVTER